MEPHKDCVWKNFAVRKIWKALLDLTTDGSSFPYIGRDDFERKRTGAKVLGLIRERRTGWRL